jgi:hypothetical protein
LACQKREGGSRGILEMCDVLWWSAYALVRGCTWARKSKRLT